jgi:hypothetical protein
VTVTYISATVTTVAGRPTNQIVLDEESIIDLTAEVASRALKWKAPRENGTWKIIAFYESYTNQRSCAGGVGATDVIANGSWIVDHFSSHGAKRITDFWDANVIDTQEMKDLIASAGHYCTSFVPLLVFVLLIFRSLGRWYGDAGCPVLDARTLRAL